jgi:hypothetical protein
MQWLIGCSLLLVFLIITIEDMKHRAVHLFWFPIVLVLTLSYAYPLVGWEALVRHLLVVAVFLSIQAFLLVLYFMLKHKKWINMTDQYIGWGDVLFMVVIIPLFSPLSYILFYVVSLLITIMVVLMFQLIRKPITFIPLAGIQSCFLMFVLVGHQWNGNLLFMEDFSVFIHIP